MKGKAVCRTHGGLSAGPRTEAGKLRARTANLKHGRETREARTERSLASARLAALEAVGHKLGFMGGTRTRGIKPHKMGKVLPELQEAVRRLRIKMPREKISEIEFKNQGSTDQPHET